MLQRLKGILFQDVKNENETKKTSVILRLHAIVMCTYFLCLLPFTGLMLPVVLCFFAYVTAFYTTYLNRTKMAVFFSHIILLIWIILSIRWWGLESGMQHFVPVLLVLAFTVCYAGVKWKVVMGVSACLIQLALVIYGHELCYSRYLLDESGSAVFQMINTIFIFVDVTLMLLVFTNDSQMMERKLVLYNEKLHRLASVDPLTGLMNRRSMREYLEKRVLDCKTGRQENLSLAIGDIDFFKRVNDTYGHEGGDVVLKKLAAIFKEELNEAGAVSRWGGEEFLFVFNNMNGDEALVILSDLRKRLEKLEIPYKEERIRVTMTFGLSEYDFRSAMDEFISEADGKLYRGKEEGRNRIVY